MLRLVSLLCPLLLLSLQMAQAQVKSKPTDSARAGDLDRLEEIVVLATKIPTNLEALPFAAGAVGKERLQRGRQQLGLDEALAG
ncbi:MAG: hypothetical protein RQ826_15970, partial [Xanthomonadales bacterium]|nr:hypothetical protein [Xanthomonadales bacterium]